MHPVNEGQLRRWVKYLDPKFKDLFIVTELVLDERDSSEGHVWKVWNCHYKKHTVHKEETLMKISSLVSVGTSSVACKKSCHLVAVDVESISFAPQCALHELTVDLIDDRFIVMKVPNENYLEGMDAYRDSAKYLKEFLGFEVVVVPEGMSLAVMRVENDDP